MPKSYTPYGAANPVDNLAALNDVFQEKEDYFLGLLGDGQNVQQRVSGTAGETLPDRAPAYLNISDNEIYLMDADASGPKAGIIRGFVDGGVLAGADATLVISGVMSGFSGLTGYGPVYVDIVAGTISQTRPIATLDGGQIMVAEMGFAVGTDTVFVRPRPIQYHLRAVLSDNETKTVVHHPDAVGYTRRAMAYMQTIVDGASIESYSSSNQDNDVALAGASYAGSVLDTGTQTGGTTVLGDAANTEYQQAQSFQLSAGGQLSQFTFVLAANAGSPVGDLNWDIRADNAGNPTGTILATGSIANGSVVASATNTVNVSNGPILQSGTSYWLKLYPASAQSVGVRWQLSFDSTGSYANGLLKYSTNGGSSWNSDGGTNDIGITVTVAALDPYDKLAQTFTLAGTETVGEILLWLKKVGSPAGTLTVRIETTSGGNPTGTLVDADAEVTFSEANLSTSYANHLMRFPSTYSLGAGTYAIVLSTSRSDSSINYVDWGADGSSPSYSGGEMKGYVDSSWNNLTKDAVFELREASIYHPSWMKVGWWSTTHADLVNRFGDGAGADLETKTTFKNTLDAGFADVTMIVELN